jgi:plastocyanin
MISLRALKGAAVAGIFAAVAAGVAGAAPVGGSVAIDNFTFNPAPVTVPVGASVTWTNDDDVPHTVRADDGSFHSKPMDSGDSFSMTFTKPGVYSYFCSIHPKMVGKVIVKAS